MKIIIEYYHGSEFKGYDSLYCVDADSCEFVYCEIEEQYKRIEKEQKTPIKSIDLDSIIKPQLSIQEELKDSHNFVLDGGGPLSYNNDELYPQKPVNKFRNWPFNHPVSD